MWSFASVYLYVCMYVCMYRARAKTVILSSWGVKNEWKDLKFIV